MTGPNMELSESTKAARVRASLKYNTANTKQIKISLNKKTDADIIEFLDKTENVQGLLKDLIRKRISE